MVVQVNGKVRDRIEVAPDISEAGGRGVGPGVPAGGRGAAAAPSPGG